MTYIFVAYHPEYKKPIVASNTFDGILDALDEYYGPENKRGVWYPYDCKYPDDYEGYIEYHVLDEKTGETEIEEVRIYCTDFNLIDKNKQHGYNY